MGRKKAVIWFEQGDVCLIPVTIPQEAEAIAGDVLRHGEATGHSHRVRGRAELLEHGTERVRYLRLFDHVEVVHEEHRPIHLPRPAAPFTGYEVRVVKEWDHFAEEAREVVD